MICDQLRGNYELYALGALEGEEKHEIDAHLARGCATCRASLSDAHAMNALFMAISIDQVSPPPRLKRRLRASLGIPSPGWSWAAALAAACMLLVALWLADQERTRARDLAQARAGMLQAASDRDRLAQALQFLNQPETRALGFSNGARGHVLVNPNRGIVLACSNLPHLPEGKTLEMWLIPKTGSPRPAGLFQADSDGTALHFLPGAIDPAAIGAVAVTIEPESGSPSPTSTPLLTANLPP